MKRRAENHNIDDSLFFSILFLCKPFLASISPITSDKASEVADRILAISPHAINAVSASGASPSSVTDRRSSTDMLLDEVKALRKEVADLRRSRSQFQHNNNVRRKRSNSRSSKLCWYHFRFQANAKKCIPPCSFTENPTLGE
ncbi:uncharacterized protein TNCV_172071 [Trichonephila clavipes]|nr:uncharacterized protein TNCV_172071 [Trichonephila clavipes]